MPGARQALWVLICLTVTVAVAYWPVGRFGFVRFDDPTYVTENPHVLGGLTWPAIRWAFTSGYGANWHPLTWLSHMLDVQLYGLSGGAHHAVNVLLHAASAALLFGVLRRMTGAAWRSAFVAGAFALHPIHVESVAWVAERKDVLSAFFWMSTLWAYSSYVRGPRGSRYALVMILFALGLMAKPMVVTLPFALLLLDFWPLKRIERGEGWLRPLGRLVREKLPLFAMSAASSVITYVVQQRGGTVASGVRLPLAGRIANAVVSYIAYLEKTFWPVHLAAYYPYPRAQPTGWILASALLVIAASVAAILLARRHPYVFVGWFWYIGTLIPAIGIVQVGTQAMADRYTYIPVIGVFIIVAWAAGDLLDVRVAWKVPTAVVASGVLAACAFATRMQVRYWESSTTLWKHALAVTIDNYAAHTYYGNALATQGDVAGAIAQYDEAIRVRPDYPEAHNNLGPALAQSGRLDDAVAQFREAIQLRPNYADAHSNLGVALASQRKFNEAIAEYTEALRLDPEHPRARTNLGLALQATGRTADAVRELELAVQMNPNNVDARNALNSLRSQRQ
jgi:Flp pilus assembly protein TadD